MKTSLHNNMKKFFVLGMLVIMVMTCPQHTYAQNNVGINNTTPDPSAALDVKSGSGLNQGILPTFVDLATATFPAPGPANGLFVHNSNSAYGQGTGIYQNIGTPVAPIWYKFMTRNDGWYLYGNRITSAGTPATYGTSKIPSGNWLGAANAADLVFGTDSTEWMRLTSTGSLGIGTYSTFGRVTMVGNSSAALTLQQYNNASNTSNNLYFRRSTGAFNVNTAVSAGTILGQIFFQGYSGSSYAEGARIRSEAEATVSTTSMPGNLTFWTTPNGSTTLNERMRIDNAGNIGINKVPIYKLDVENGTDRSYFHAGTAGSTESYVTIARSNFEGVNAFAYNDDAVEGTTSNALYNAFYGKNSNAGGDAIWGENTAATGTGVGAGVVGITAQSGTGSAGVWGQNSNTTGTGTVGTGQGQAGSVLVNGSGGAFTGNTTGAYIKSNAAGNYALQVNGTGNGTYTTTANPATYWGLVVGAGSALAAGQTWSTSDGRFKKNVNTIPNGTLQKIMNLNPCNYVYDSKKYPMFKGETRKQSGFIAQEVEQVFPELVTNQKYMPDPTFDPTANSGVGTKSSTSKKNVNTTADNEIPQVKGYYAVDYVSLIPYLVKAIQEQQLIIESLKAEIDDLKAK